MQKLEVRNMRIIASFTQYHFTISTLCVVWSVVIFCKTFLKCPLADKAGNVQTNW